MSALSFRQRAGFWLASRLGWLLVLVLGRLTRTEILGQDHLASLRNQGRPFILCIWHGRMLLPIFLHRRSGLYAMVSQHRDGEMIARVLQRLGYRTIRGSSTRGGREALHRMVAVLRRGANAAVIPDGPRGPRHHFRAGAIRIAQRSGACLLPLTFGASRAYSFRSWDRFMLWFPFAKTVAVYGPPVEVPRQIDSDEVEVLRRRIEAGMVRLQRFADAYFQR